MIRAGESTGQLTSALTQAADQLEHDEEFRARLRQALAYPLILAVSGAASLTVIVVFIIPRFAALLGDVGQALPPATRLLMQVATLLHEHWMLLGSAMTFLLGATLAVLKREQSRYGVHVFCLQTPGLGNLLLATGSARFLMAFAAATRAGLPLLAAITACADAAGNLAIRERLFRAITLISEGRPLSIAVRDTKALSPLAIEFLRIGEASGSVPAMSARAAALLRLGSERQLASALRLLEPALVVLFGGLTAFVAGVLLQTVYSLRPAA
jgi:type II secretory pathway component PulF